MTFNMKELFLKAIFVTVFGYLSYTWFFTTIVNQPLYQHAKNVPKGLRTENGKTSAVKNHQSKMEFFQADKHFEEMLSKYAQDNVIVLSVTDLGYVELAENLYESSFKRFNIDNYLFVCSHEKAEQYLTSRNIHAISLWNDANNTESSVLSKREFNRKTNLKTEAVYLALCLGYSVLLVDVDIVFLQNPFPYLLQFSENYDLIVQSEYHKPNSGFYLATNKGPSKELHEKMMAANTRLLSQQKHLKLNLNGLVKVKLLPWNLFPWGGYYFYDTHREFAGDNHTGAPLIFHCTRSAGLGAKRYRLREFLMWRVDTDGYYSSTKRKYVTFELPVNLWDKTAQRNALIAGFELATLMNRTLILPKFHCQEKRTAGHHCNCLSVLGKRVFSLDSFEGLYREHMFLHQPLVPHNVKQSQSDMINIVNVVDKQHLDVNQTNLLLQALKEFEAYSVIRLYDLHNITIQEKSPLWERFQII